MDGIGGFLCELSVVERVQPEPLCRRIDVLPPRARLHLAGGQCEVDLDADRRAIAEALRSVADVVDPCVRRVPVAARADRQSLWAGLLGDLGLYSADMASISRARAPGRGALRYHRIERSGNQALVTVTDGQTSLTRSFDLDAGQLPVAIPVEIADSFSPPAHRPTHWGAPPPRTGHLRAWVRRLMRRP